VTWNPGQAARQKERRQALREQRGGAASTADGLVLCDVCGQQIASLARTRHQRNVYCRAQAAALEPVGRGLVRSPGDGLIPMLEAAGVPYEVHPTAVRATGDGPTDRFVAICQEAWVPPESVAIVQADRPLEERRRALHRFAGWYTRHGRANAE